MYNCFIMDRHNLSFEPMDIDISNQSVKDMDISYDDSDDSKLRARPCSRLSVSFASEVKQNPQKNSPMKSVVKKYHINIQKPPRSTKNRLLKIIFAVIVIVISILSYQILNLNCCDQLNLEVLRKTISNKLYGQSAAVELLIKTLALEVRSKILFLSGGTGVGKTFTSSLILNTVSSCSNVYHYTMPTFEQTFSTEALFGLTMCKMSLIVVDDLTLNNINVKVHIKNVIEKSETLGKNITVILIYNCNENHKNLEQRCDETFKSKLFDDFYEVKALKRFIQFEPLSETHLRKCIEQELGDKQLNDIEFADLLKNFNVSVDGCKGVHSKVKYLNIV